MYVTFVPEGSSEWKAGLRPGDRIQALDSMPQRNWRALNESLVRGAEKMRKLEWTRLGQPLSGGLPAPQGAVGGRPRPAGRELRLSHEALGTEGTGSNRA